MISNEEAEKVRGRLYGQDKLIFDISCETGLRISDILNIKKREINKIMYIREAKTKKHKIIEFSDKLYKRLKAYEDHNADVANYAFYSTRKPQRHIHRSTYHRHLKKAIQGTQIDCSAHSTRKLYAMNIFERDKNIFDVQKALNHKYITTTATYLGLDLAQLIREAAERKT